jgi:Cu2+-exporting ATPase
LPDPPVTGEGVDGAFCCTGCREIARTLDDLDDPEAVRASVREAARGTEAGGAAVPDDAEEAFLQVDGMHCTACEAFLETLAEGREGVYRAEASYASEMMRLQYDPGRVAADALPEAVSRAGYRARASTPDAADARPSEDDQNQIARLVIGGFFGVMVMMWYVVFLYPVYAGGGGVVELSGSFASYALSNVWVATTVVLGVTGWPILRGAAVSLRVLQPNMDLLVALAAGSAYLYSTGALLMGWTEVYFDVTVVIVLAVTIGRWVERRVKHRAAGLLARLTREQVDEARRVDEDGRLETVPVDALAPGDRVQVPAGGRVPIDGTVAEGRAAVDEALLTGESRPVSKEPGDPVVGGSVVQTNGLVVRVGDAAESTLERLVRVMWDVQASTPGVQSLADRLASVFVPVVLLLAAGTVAVQLGLGAPLPEALLTALTVLIVSCPCALGLATPLAVAAGTRAALRRGIVVKHAGVFERPAEAWTVVFDKTGTLTTGAMRVHDTVGDAEALRRARAVERRAAHPVAAAIAEADLGREAVPAGPAEPDVREVRTHARGVEARVDGTPVFVGHPGAYREGGGRVPADIEGRLREGEADGHVPVVVGWEGQARGGFVVGDALRDDAGAVLDRLAASTRRIAVLTGDHEAAAAPLEADPRIDDVFAGVRPEAKQTVLRRWQAEGPVAMIGDGSNDAPALATADLGIAFGPTALAAESADVVILRDALSRVPDVFDLAGATRRRIRQNLGWAFGYNAVAIPLAIAGLLNPLAAALAMASSSLLVVLNSTRELEG